MNTEQITIYHNPRCKKSQGTLKLLRENGLEPEIIEYLKTPPSKEELKQLLGKLGLDAQKLVRKTEKEYKENFKGQALTEDEWIDAMIRFPKLIERPIVVKGDHAVIGRPPENVNDLLTK